MLHTKRAAELPVVVRVGPYVKQRMHGTFWLGNVMRRFTSRWFVGNIKMNLSESGCEDVSVGGLCISGNALWFHSRGGKTNPYCDYWT
jgi:hypothetical protein